MNSTTKAALFIGGLLAVVWLQQGGRREARPGGGTEAEPRAGGRIPALPARTRVPTEPTSADALRIVEVSWEPGETIMRQRTRLIVAKVRNTSRQPQDLWIASRDGLKMSREELGFKRQEWKEQQSLSREEREQMARSFRQARGSLLDGGQEDSWMVKEEETRMPYGLGIEARSNPTAAWGNPVSMWIWVPTEGGPSPPERIEQAKIKPGETRSFSIRMPAAGELFAAESFRVFIISPDFKRVDESILSPQ